MIIKAYLSNSNAFRCGVKYHFFYFGNLPFRLGKKSRVAWVNTEGGVHSLVAACLRNGKNAGFGGRADVDNGRKIACKKGAKS